jgi:isocitrate/isopropylmalate dehydrogenase
MLSHLGLAKASADVERAVDTYLERSPKSEFPFEFGGEFSCVKVGEAILKQL